MSSNKEQEIKKFYPKLKLNLESDLSHRATDLTPYTNKHLSRSWFWANEVTNIYNIPAPTNNKVVVAVVSFGGGLYGNVDSSGNLTNGDVQKYWLSLGISPSNLPNVMVKAINGAQNTPNDSDSGLTMENTIDVETIGAACPTSNLTIILYIAPNSLRQFPNLISYILNDSIIINNVKYGPNVISISWGAPEIYYGSSLLNSMNNFFSFITSANVGSHSLIPAACGVQSSLLYGGLSWESGHLSGVHAPDAAKYITALLAEKAAILPTNSKIGSSLPQL
jgi:hypothetical protein